MLYIILILAVVVIYVVYRKQKPSEASKIKAREKLHLVLKQKQVALLDFINASELKNYLQDEVLQLECNEKNFVRLSERFKHDDVKFAQVVKDWIDYIDMLRDLVTERLLLDISTSETSKNHDDAIHYLSIKIQEIEKRFKDLLGSEYLSPERN